MVCYLVYSDLPNKYTKLEENFGGFMNRSLVRFEFEKSPLQTIVYGATGTGKTYFVKQFLKLYLDQEQYQDNEDIIEWSSVLAPNKSKSKDKNKNKNKSVC